MSDTDTWYHGSPKRLSQLRTGSTITRNREFAEIFSHEPTLVVLEDDGRIRHNGVLKGYLYVVDERVRPEDIIPHPRSTLPPNSEWLTERPMRLRYLGEVKLSEEKRLGEDEVAQLLQRLDAMKFKEEAQDGA